MTDRSMSKTNRKLDRQTLPEKQREVLKFIDRYVTENGYPPSTQEICAHMEVASTFGVRKHIEALVAKGFLKRGEARSARTLTVVRQ